MRIRTVLGAAFLMLGTVGVAFVYGAYNDLDVDYRDDGMILLDDEPWYPRGVMFIPCPNERERGEEINPGADTFYKELQDNGRGFCFTEFAAQGGNFLIYPCFHLNEPEGVRPTPFFEFEDLMPCDITDIYITLATPECDYDLDAASAAGIKIIAAPSLAYEWESLTNDYPPYCRFMQDSNGVEGGVVGGGGPRSTASINDYFDDVAAMVTASGSEEAFLGWCNCWEPVCRRSSTYLHQVYDDIRAKETAANASHPVYLEVNEIARDADHFRETNTACDILGYNIRICPAPQLWDWINPEWPEPGPLGWASFWLNNRWASITGDAADMHFWSVDGEKTLICCVDGVWCKGYFPSPEQVRFMTYDAIIHRVNGLYWGMEKYVFPPNKDPSDYVPDSTGYKLSIKPAIGELGSPLTGGGVEELLTAPFDDLMVEAIVTEDEDVVERTAIIGGDLAPKNHYCSGRYLVEACAKYMEEEGPMGVTPYVYLIVACRDGRATVEPGDPPASYNEYEVTFRPYFSGTWNAATVEVVNESRSLSVVNGTFTDTIISEGVHIYKFEKPSKLTGS